MVPSEVEFNKQTRKALGTIQIEQQVYLLYILSEVSECCRHPTHIFPIHTCAMHVSKNSTNMFTRGSCNELYSHFNEQCNILAKFILSRFLAIKKLLFFDVAKTQYAVLHGISWSTILYQSFSSIMRYILVTKKKLSKRHIFLLFFNVKHKGFKKTVLNFR